MDCLFCKIIAGDIPSTKVYEDDDVFAFLDIQPVNVGHTLIVPKAHSTDLLEMDDATVGRVFVAAKRVGAAVLDAVDADGFNIGVNTRPAAGQVIFHAHVHVMPRFADDGLQHWPKRQVGDEESLRAAEAIRKNLEK